MSKSIKLLEQISQECSSQTTIYKFSKSLDVSDRYKQGRIEASKWLNDLTYYYFKEEKNFIKEYTQQLIIQKEKLLALSDSDYKKGLLEQLNQIEQMINDSTN